MPLTVLDKELVAVAISVAAGCRPCTTHHLVEARRAGASDAAIEKAVAGAVCVRTSATESMRRYSLGLEPQPSGCGCGAARPLDELVALGVALAVNCTDNIDKHRAAAEGLGIPQNQIDEVFALVTMIRAKAIGHAEARVNGNGTHFRSNTWAEAPRSSGCC